MKVGDYVEIMRSDPPDRTYISRGIVLEVEDEIGLWPTGRIYLFNEQNISWYYEYDITVISEASDDGEVRDILSCDRE